MDVSIVVGNPKPASRTWHAARRIAQAISPDVVAEVDLTVLGARLFDPGDDEIAGIIGRVAASDVVVIASPTYKASYTGLLKLFLDRFATGTGLEGVVAVPLMLGGNDRHALAPEVHLRPVLSELGASVPTPGLYLLDQAPQPDPFESSWLERWVPVIRQAAGG